MAGFADIPERQNGIDQLIDASWFNTIRTKLVEAFGSGGYIFEQDAQTKDNGDEISVEPTAFKPLIPLQGNGGAVTLSSTPFGTTHGFGGGKEIILMGLDDTNLVTIEINDVPGGVIAPGKIVLSRFEMVILIYVAALDRFVKKE